MRYLLKNIPLGFDSNDLDVREGDMIQMIKSCGNQKEGYIYQVRTDNNGSAGMLSVQEKEDTTPFGKGSFCYCPEKWKLLERKRSEPNITPEFQEGDMIEMTENCNGLKKGDHYQVQNKKGFNTLPTNGSHLFVGKASETKATLTGFCHCPQKWRLVKRGKEVTTEPFQVGDTVITKETCGSISPGHYYTVFRSANGTMYISTKNQNGALTEACTCQNLWIKVNPKDKEEILMDIAIKELCSDPSIIINNNNELKTNIMTPIKAIFKNLFTSEPTKTFMKAGIVDSQNNITSEGHDIFIAYLLQKHGDEFKKDVVDLILKARKEEKE